MKDVRDTWWFGTWPDADSIPADAIRQLMRTDRQRYFQDERMQRRYRELLDTARST